MCVCQPSVSDTNSPLAGFREMHSALFHYFPHLVDLQLLEVLLVFFSKTAGRGFELPTRGPPGDRVALSGMQVQTSWQSFLTESKHM